MVEEFAAAVAPYHPWWHAVLTPDQQVYRWMQIREPIITWLADAAPFMGWPTPAAALDGLYELFTSRAAYDAVPPDLWI
ncbi:hypothetical protein, partial [Streptococcus pneumoniae]|uniref:hypothetical protein n=1 Tax=Streptococcus pneumoniae TaxID=1313 RepID=UPI001E56114A